jgi:hypothetical protein
MFRTLALLSLCTAVTAVAGSQQPNVPAPPGPSAPGRDAARARFLEMFARGYFPGRSGQVMVVAREGDIITRDEPDIRYMHGSPWPYDTSIPMFFAGRNVRPGSYAVPAVQQDVAVTIAAILGAAMPPTTSGRVLPVVRAGAAAPRVVLLLVLDGMRADYFARYAKEMPALTALRARGAVFTQARVNVLPSNTAVGHATIATGADPRVHGITGNNLYEQPRKARHDMFEGWDPRDLVSPTLADVWQLQTAGRAIIVAQGSSVPSSTALAGHGACQAGGAKVTHAGYDERSGKWMTKADCFTQPPTIAELDARTLWPPDGLWMGHKIDTPAAVRRSGLFPRFETEAFSRLLDSQPIGKDGIPDLLLLNFKGADYVGHKHGPDSPELAATLAEMDRHLARILKTIEERSGGDFLLAVTADHGMPPEPSGSGTRRHFAPDIVAALHKRFDPESGTLVTYYEPENAQIFIDADRLAALKLTLDDVTSYLRAQPFIFAAFTEEEVRRAARRPGQVPSTVSR